MRAFVRFLLAVSPLAVSAQQTEPVTAIVGATLIDGNGGAPVPNATVVVRGTRIASVGPSSAVTVPRGARTIDATGKYILPGFVDANVHVSIYSGIENFARYHDRFTDVVIEAAQKHLKAGVTTIRDSYGMIAPLHAAREMFRTGKAIGPRLLFAGNIVGWGGPWSFSWSGRPPENLSLLQEQMNDAITRGSGEDLVNMGPDSLRVAINRYLDLGVDFIKYGGTGHFGYPTFIGFSERAQKVMVDAAHARGLVAETHSTTPEGLRISLEAGVDHVQHPEILDVPMSDELVKMFVDRGVVCGMLSNTMTGKPWQDYARRRVREDSSQKMRADSLRVQPGARPRTEAELRRDRGDLGLGVRRENAKKLIAGGCITAIATDNYLGLAPEFRRDPKPDWQEPGLGSLYAIEGLVELGMTPMQALVAGTKNGALASKALKDYGTIEVGKSADILLLGADPLADIRNIRKLDLVMSQGVVVDYRSLPTIRIWSR